MAVWAMKIAKKGAAVSQTQPTEIYVSHVGNQCIVACPDHNLKGHSWVHVFLAWSDKKNQQQLLIKFLKICNRH